MFIAILISLGTSWCSTKTQTKIETNSGSILQQSWIQTHQIQDIPSRASKEFQSDMKLIGLQKDISYETLWTEENQHMSIVWFDTKESITRETTRATQENNLIQQEYRKDILLDKIYKDKEYIHTASTGQTIINDLIQKITDGQTFTYYKKTTQKEKRLYTTHIRIGDTIVILDIQWETKKTTNTDWTQRFLIPTWSHDFCERLVIQDEKWNRISTMKEVEEALSWCDNESISISPNNKFLFFNTMTPPDKMSEYMIYNFETKTLLSVGYEDITVEGMRCIRNENNKDIACAMVDQNKYPWLTKIIIFTIDDYGFTEDAQEFIQQEWESMAFVCGWSCYLEQFSFIDDHTLEYNGHDLIAPGKKFRISYQ